MAAETKDLTVTALSRAMDILLYIYKKGQPVHISDIARDMGEHKSTVYRALYTMEQKGFVEKDAVNDTYWLGMKLFAIGMRIQEKMSITDLVHPYTEQLYEELQEVVNICVLEMHAVDTPKVIVVEKEESDTHMLKANPGVGKYSDCHSSAAGKCLLAFSNEFDIDSVEPFVLREHTENTITDWEEFTETLHMVRSQGYAVDNEEREYGLTCIGAPVIDRSGNAVAAVSVAGPTRRMQKDFQHKVDAVMNTAEKISKKFI